MNTMTKSLTSIVSEIATLENSLIESGGEITPEIENAIALRDSHLPAKIDSYAIVMERFGGVAEFYKAKADSYLKLARAANAIIDRCENNLREALRSLETKTLEGNDVVFRLSPSNPKVVFDNENLIDDAYKVTETVVKIDRKRIADDLKIGVPVPGAHLEESYSLRKSVNRGKK